MFPGQLANPWKRCYNKINFQTNRIERNAEMKSKITSCINNFAEWTVIIILLVISCFLTITSFLYHFEEHTSSVLFDNIFTSLLAIAIFLALVLLLSRLLNPVYKLFSHIDKILLVITLLWVCCFSYFFVIGAKTLPCSDAKSVYDIAVRMYNGDIGAVVPTGSYLSLWPFQTGLIFIFGFRCSCYSIHRNGNAGRSSCTRFLERISCQLIYANRI